MMGEVGACAVQSQLADIGVEVELVSFEWTILLEVVNAPPEKA